MPDQVLDDGKESCYGGERSMGSLYMLDASVSHDVFNLKSIFPSLRCRSWRHHHGVQRHLRRQDDIPYCVSAEFKDPGPSTSTIDSQGFRFTTSGAERFDDAPEEVVCFQQMIGRGTISHDLACGGFTDSDRRAESLDESLGKVKRRASVAVEVDSV